MVKMRTESDSLGDILVPADRLYGASTARAVENFPPSALRFPLPLLYALARIKKAAALANAKLGMLDAERAKAIGEACDAVIAGDHDNEFPVDVFQTGSGTSTNMNMNEVIANLANLSLGKAIGSRAPVHPNDHVNLGQSSNDVFPTAIHLAAGHELTSRLLPVLDVLQSSLQEKSASFLGIYKSGRTHLQDAIPVSLGQEFSGYSEQVRKSCQRLGRACDALLEVPLGGTAVGTGINAHPQFAKEALALLSAEEGVAYREAANHFEANACRDACVDVSGSLKTVAVSLCKIADDIRWMSSDTVAELALPSLQPGSSIMPGKSNPVICEAVLQIGARVIGNDTTITLGGLGGNFELNTMMPIIAYALLESISLLTNAALQLDTKCVRMLEPRAAQMKDRLERNAMLATVLVPLVGYDRAAEIAKSSRAQGISIRDAALASGLVADSIDPLFEAAMN